MAATIHQVVQTETAGTDTSRIRMDLGMAAGYAGMAIFWAEQGSPVLTVFSVFSIGALMVRALRCMQATSTPEESSRHRGVSTKGIASPRLGEAPVGEAPSVHQPECRGSSRPVGAGLPTTPLMARLVAGRPVEAVSQALSPGMQTTSVLLDTLRIGSGRLPDHRPLAAVFRDAARLEHHRHATLVQQLRRTVTGSQAVGTHDQLPRRIPRVAGDSCIASRVPEESGLARAAA